MTAQFAPYKVQSPLSSIVFTPLRGREVTTNAIIDTGATASVCPANLVDKFGWAELAAKAEEPLALVGVGVEEAKTYVGGTLLIDERLLRSVRLWMAPISIAKVLLGSDVLSQVAKIELAYGNLQRFQVATVEGVEAEVHMQPALVKRAVEHLTKLRAMDFGDTVLSAETQEKIRDLMVKWARIFPRDDKDIACNDSMPMRIGTGDAKPIAQAVRRVSYAPREPLEKKLQTWIDMGILVHDNTCEWLTCTILCFVLVLGKTKTKLFFGFAMVF